MEEYQRTFESCADILADIDFTAVREWKGLAPGRKAIAYFPVYAPVELIHAAGMLPVGLAGAGDRLDLQHADARFGSFICSIIKTTLEMAHTRHLECLDGMLFSTICDSARNLCWVLKRNFPELRPDFIHLPQNCSSPATAEFLADEYRRILRQLEEIAGHKVTEVGLQQSIHVFNENRNLVRRLCALRVASPHLIAAWEAYALVRAGYLIPVEEHNRMLSEMLAALPKRQAKKRDSIRIVIEGSFCEQPSIGLLRLIEDAGCYVVSDDLTLGRNWFAEDVPITSDPIGSLAASYVDHSSYSSVRHDFRRPRWRELGRKVREVRADAVLFLIAKFCEPAYFDYVPFKQELEEAGIPHLLLEFEEKQFTFDRLRTEIETFVESLVFDQEPQ
jgi:benzoyl-CoA reductase subunit C